MKIEINQPGGPNMTIPIPDFLLTSPGLLKFGLKIGKHYAGQSMPDIPPEALDALCAAIKEIKRQHGSWELVNIESSSGERVTITL